MNDWNEKKNKLTWDLFEQGYTKDNHPDYVKWYANMQEFEYTTEFLNTSVWEAPCGIIRKGQFTGGYLSHGGIDWRVENNNYNFNCPYKKKECEFSHPILKSPNCGGQCSWHLSQKPYDYSNSAEKIEDERKELIKTNLNKRFGTNGMISCACCHIDEDTCEPYFKYNPWECIRFTSGGCWMKTCWCTGKERDLTLGNIYYDVKVTTEYRQGFIVEPVIQITKGKKLFDNRKAMTDLKMFLKVYPDEVFQREKMRHSRQLFYNEHFGNKFEIEVQNVRIEKRESRDLLQDFQDISEGIQVIHKSDEVKKAKEAKKERRIKYLEAKEKKKSKAKENKISMTEQLTIF